MMEVLEGRGLVKRYPNTVAVDGVHFRLRKGEILGLLGPNGAGKSTLIGMLSTLIPPSEGEILLDGIDVLKNPNIIMNRLGVVPQEIALYPDLTGEENLLFFGRVYGLKGKALRRRVEEVLEIINLTDRARERVGRYSGGMKRRINIGAALLHRPEILFMDEPTVGIDPQSRRLILDTIKDLNREGLTILYTSHYMEEVDFLCDRIYIMDHGKIIADGTKEELIARISNEETIELDFERNGKEFLPALEGLPGVHAVHQRGAKIEIVVEKGMVSLGKIVHLAENSKTSLLSVEVKKPTLEDLFLHLTGRGLRE
ncbi:ATP-binding cassette domain-containing protein [Hydrogenibacillus schlegelii]|uniref:ABC transporter ATP-binding protein n=1 Tax=Hydrogenibacillus schlegelii TaxID=1484 RepID=UPI0039EB514B